MKAVSLLLLRTSCGFLMVLWGMDKLVNPDHALFVSNTFYLGLFSALPLLRGFGVVQIVMGLLVAVGLGRRLLYPLLGLITGVSMLAVWQSVVDPLGFVFENTKRLFYPSLIIFAAVLVLAAFRDEDKLSLDRRLVE